jgi:putative ABC transport system permease protein
MTWIRVALARLRALVRRDAIVDEIREEMDFHVDMRAEDYARDGLPPEDARLRAVRQFGNAAMLQDRGYDIRGGGVFESIWQDIRYGIRSLRQSPTFTGVALTILALAIGAASAIFSVVDATFVRSLPYEESDRIVAVLGVDTRHATTFGNGVSTPQTFLDWRRLQQSFDGLALVGASAVQLDNPDGPPATLPDQQVTSDFFRVLRARPLLGRLFTEDDQIPGRDQVAILSFGLWQQLYGGDPDAIGRTIRLDDEAWRVVGVMPRDFAYPPAAGKATQIYVPLTFDPEDTVRGETHNYTGIALGRLKPGLSMSAAQAQMNRVAESLDREYPKWEPGWRVRVEPLHDRLVGTNRQWMLLLIGLAGLVVLVACANAANLMLARATVRSREFGIRRALGAGRGRLARALLIESLELAIGAGLIGIGLAYGGVQLLAALLPASVPRVASIGVDTRVLGIAVGTSLLTGLLFGLAPAIGAGRPKLTETLKDGGRGTAGGGRAGPLRSLLVVAQFAIAVVLLVGAGLFVASFAKLMRVEPGFRIQDTLVIKVALMRNQAGGETDAAANARGERTLSEAMTALRQLPGVTSVASVGGGSPLSDSWSRSGVKLPGGDPNKKAAPIDVRRVTPNYFAQLGIPVLEGRGVSDDDRGGGQRIVVVNRTAAEQYWPGRSPVGTHIMIHDRDHLVIGVVADIRQYGPEELPRQCAFVPRWQEPSIAGELLIQTTGDPMALLPAVRTTIWTVDHSYFFAPDVNTLEGEMDRLVASRRFNMALIGLLGLLGLVIAAVGIFGVMAYTVAQRTGEIGVRMALGATPAGIVTMVLRAAVLLIVAGLGIGALAAWPLSALTSAFLFQVEPTDVRVFALALAVLAVVGLAAAAIPARRAARVDPLHSLRES